MNLTNPKDALLLALLVALAVAGAEPGAVNALPGFSDHTGPTEMRVSSFERLDVGCRDAVATSAGGSVGGDGDYSRVSFVGTGDPNADLSAWVERTSPPRADLSTFRVHVESHGSGRNASNASGSCEMGVRYSIEVKTSGGSPEGFLPDAHGVRVLWLENGEYAGCSAGYTSPLEGDCSHLYPEGSDPDRSWANATTK